MTGEWSPKVVHPDGRWLEDLRVGMSFESEEHELTRDSIVRFAEQFDPQPFHLSDAGAAGSFFDALVASGWHTAAVTMRLLVDCDLRIATGIVGAGGEVSWPSAALPGDRLHITGSITDILVSRSRPDRAFFHVSYKTLNHEGEIRQESSARLLVWRRPFA